MYSSSSQIKRVGRSKSRRMRPQWELDQEQLLSRPVATLIDPSNSLEIYGNGITRYLVMRRKDLTVKKRADANSSFPWPVSLPASTAVSRLWSYRNEPLARHWNIETGSPDSLYRCLETILAFSILLPHLRHANGKFLFWSHRPRTHRKRGRRRVVKTTCRELWMSSLGFLLCVAEQEKQSLLTKSSRYSVAAVQGRQWKECAKKKCWSGIVVGCTGSSVWIPLAMRLSVFV